MNRKYLLAGIVGAVPILILCSFVGSICFPIVLVNDRTDFILFGDYGPYTSKTTAFYETLKPEVIQFIKDQGFTEKSNPKWRSQIGVEALDLQNRKEPYIILSKRYRDLSEVYIFVQPACEFYENSQNPVGIEVRYIYRYWQFYYGKPRFLTRNPVEMWNLHRAMNAWWAERCKNHPHPFDGGGSEGAACIPNTPSQSTDSISAPR